MQKNLYVILITLLFAYKTTTAMQFIRIQDPEERPQFSGTVVRRKNFFKDIMANSMCPTEASLRAFLHTNEEPELLSDFIGFEQSSPISLHKGNLVIQSQSNQSDNTTYQCGSFQLCSIGDLQDRCNNMVFPGGGKFNVIEGVDISGNSWFRHHLDIGALQADPANCNAVFQVASNFNALETTGANQNIEDQYLENYVHDLTQGPAASISAAPGLIQRHYFMYADNSPKSTWSQTLKHHINFLDELDTLLPVSQAGYVVLPENPGTMTSENYRAIKIGYHANVQVTYGFMLDKKQHYFIAKTNPNQIINQVFTAAIDFGSTNRQLRNNQAAQAIAQNILNAAYEGTLRKAFIDDKRQVFLTLVGGGVFGNDLVWIFNAINRMISFIQNSGLNVTVIWRSSSNSGNHVRQQLAQLVKQTGGHYQQFRADGIYQPQV